MVFGSYSFNTLTAIKGIAFRALEKFTTAQIADTGIKVVRLLKTFKAKHPDKIPRVPGGGLLHFETGVEANDFELALHLVNTNDPAMAKLIKDAKGLPVLIAYLATLTNGPKLPQESLLESALPFAVTSLTAESEVSKFWNRNLQTEIKRLKPLAHTGAKFTTGRKLNALGPLAKAVRLHLNKHLSDNAESIWNALSDKPPKGLTFHNNRIGKYVEYDKRTFTGNLKNTGYTTFANTVSAQRKSLKTLTV